MADALPNPPSAIAEAVSKYRPRVVGGGSKTEVGIRARRVLAVVLAHAC